MARYRLITLDVYTALFDIEGSLGPIVANTVGAAVDAWALVRTWRAKQLELLLVNNSLQHGHLPFARVTRLALDYALAQVHEVVSEDTRQALVLAWDFLTPWPEATDVLQTLNTRGYPLALLSNGDEAMLQAVWKRLSTPIAHTFAAEQAGFYKPHPALYQLPLHTLALAGAEVLHVAGSSTDVVGAKAAGLMCVWVNRRGERLLDPAYQADYECADLRGVLNFCT